MYRAESERVPQPVWSHPGPLLCGGCPKPDASEVTDPRDIPYRLTMLEGDGDVGRLQKKGAGVYILCNPLVGDTSVYV